MNQLSPIEALMASRELLFSVGEEYGAELKDRGVIPFIKDHQNGYTVSLIHDSNPIAQIIATIEDDTFKVYANSPFKFPSFTEGEWYSAPMDRGPLGPDFEEVRELVAKNFSNLIEYLTNIDISMLVNTLDQIEGDEHKEYSPEDVGTHGVFDVQVGEVSDVLTSEGPIKLEAGQTIRIIRK